MEVWGLEAIRAREVGGWQIEVQTQLAETLSLECDHIINAAPKIADWSLASPIAVRGTLNECFTAEPHYYVLGSKTRTLFPNTPSSIGEQMQEERQHIRSTLSRASAADGISTYTTPSGRSATDLSRCGESQTRINRFDSGMELSSAADEALFQIDFAYELLWLWLFQQLAKAS